MISYQHLTTWSVILMKTREFILAFYPDDFNEQKITEIEGYDKVPYSAKRPSSFLFKSPNGLKEWLLGTLESIQTTHPKLFAYEFKALDKWYGPQGYTIDKVTLKPIIDKYYQVTSTCLTQANLAPGLALVRYWWRKTGKSNPIIHEFSSIEIHHRMLKWEKAGGGFYYNGDKRKYITDILKSSLSHYKRNHSFKVYPAIAGYRHSKQKVRAIFKDDPRNWVAYQYYYGNAIDQLRDLPIFSWSGIKADAINAYKYSAWNNAITICCDYESMDQHVTVDHAILVDEFLVKLRLLDRAKQKERIDWLNRLFTQPLLFGSDVYVGWHTLFSGTNPTNDFETLLSLIAQAHLLEIHSPETRLSDYFPTFVGDDSRIRFRSIPQTSTLSLTSIATFLTDIYGLVANPIKQEITTEEYVYCKHLFPKNPKEKGDVYYPAVLVLNSILYPEYGDLKDPYQNVLRVLSIVDHLEYHPLRTQFLNEILRAICDTGYRDIIEFIVSNPDSLIQRSGFLARTYGKPVSLADTWFYKYILQFTKRSH